jgi:predicted nucleic acid-binding protein
MIKPVKTTYLDTSAIVMLYLEEPGSKNLQDYFLQNTNFCCTAMTFYEALNVLKRKLFKKDKGKYFKCVEDLEIRAWGASNPVGRTIIEIEEMQMNYINIFRKVNDIAIKYHIDIGDAVQIFAIMEGRYKHLAGQSASVLITADDGLEKAALDNHIRVWNCKKQNKPGWL